MNFDLNNNPPSETEIAAERVALTRTLAALRLRERWLLGGATVVAVALAAAGDMAFGGGPPPRVAAVAAATIIPAAAALVGAYLQLIDEPRSEATRVLADLDILAQKRCPEVLEWCQAHPVVAAYQTAVAQQGRMLVEGERAAMRRWIYSAASRKAQAKELAACERLMQPVAAS